MEIDPNDFKQLLTLLQKLVEKSEPAQDNESTNQEVADNGAEEDFDNQPVKVSSIKTNSKKISVKSREKIPNKFLSMRESSMHQEDIEIDRKLRKFPPTQRNRTYQEVDVVCRVCGKNDTVNPALLDSKNRYKCNKCAASPG